MLRTTSATVKTMLQREHLEAGITKGIRMIKGLFKETWFTLAGEQRSFLPSNSAALLCTAKKEV